MNLKITNSQTEIDLPGWTYELDPLRRRIGAQPKYGQDGVYITGDGKVSERKMKLSNVITATNDTDYITQINALQGIFYDDFGPFYLVDTDRGVRALIELESIAEVWSHGTERRVTRIDMGVIMVDSYFENFNVSTSTYLNVATTNTFLITNSGLVDAFPIIKVTAKATINEFTLINQRTQDQITIGTTAFVTNTVITIDCIDGTAKLDDGITITDISYAIADGTGFIYFDLGDNTIEYQSLYGNVDITVEYRPRYAF